MKNKDMIIEEIEVIIKSCEEGYSGEWDCSTSEGKEGFQSMINGLEEIKNNIKKLL